MSEDNSRSDLIEQATQAYTKGVIDQDDFEALVMRINQLESTRELTGLANQLPAIFSISWGQSSCKELTVANGNIKKQGLWLDAEAYKINLSSSNMTLDLRAYEDDTDIQLVVDIDISQSNLKIILPDTWIVIDRIDVKTASNVKIRNPSNTWGSNRLVLSGNIRGSNLKAIYR